MKNTITRECALESLRNAILNCLENCRENGVPDEDIAASREELRAAGQKLMDAIESDNPPFYRPTPAEKYWLDLIPAVVPADCDPLMLAD